MVHAGQSLLEMYVVSIAVGPSLGRADFVADPFSGPHGIGWRCQLGRPERPAPRLGHRLQDADP